MAGVQGVDPLKLLREHIQQDKSVKLQNDYLVFRENDNKVKIHRNSKCGYKLSGGEGPIDIGSVWFMLRAVSKGRSYTQDEAINHGFVYIGVRDRGDLADYLRGKSVSCKGLCHIPLVVPKKEEDKRELEHEDIGEEQQSKRARSTLTPESRQALLEDIAYEDMEENVRLVKDLDVIVRCPGREVPNVDLILKIAKDEIRNWDLKTPPQQPYKPLADGKVSLLEELGLVKEGAPDDDANCPIILFPCNKNAPVNLLNAEQLLSVGHFEKQTNANRHYFESTRAECAHVTRRIGDREVKFELRDSTKHFDKKMWKRTVAVVVDGTDWQFKGWPFESHIDLFTTIKGFYFEQVGFPIPDIIEKWGVAVLRLKRSRHDDQSLRDTFYNLLTTFLRRERHARFTNHKAMCTGEDPAVIERMTTSQMSQFDRRLPGFASMI